MSEPTASGTDGRGALELPDNGSSEACAGRDGQPKEDSEPPGRSRVGLLVLAPCITMTEANAAQLHGMA